MSEQRESGRRTAAPTTAPRASRASRAVAPPRRVRGDRPPSSPTPRPTVAAAVESLKDSSAAASLGRLRRRGGGKWIMLTLVVLSLAVALVYPLRQYMAQRDEVDKLRENTRRQQAETERMHQELERWNDPAYVRQQARERLHFVFPGDTAYQVVPPGIAAPPEPARAGSPRWYENLWDSTRDADTVPRPSASVPVTPTPTPAASIG